MKTAVLFFACVFICALAACSAIRPSPAPDTGFLPDSEKLTEMRDRAPFNGFWYADRERFYRMKQTYTKLFIAPVDTSYMTERVQKSAIPGVTKRERIEDLKELASYMHERFIDAIKQYPGMPIQIVSEPGPNTFVLELAVSELRPTNPIVNSVGTVAGFLVPGSGFTKVAGKGSIAMEGLVRDGASGEILLEFKDRATDQQALFTVRDFQQYAHARQAIQDWAMIYAELAATPSDHKVEGRWLVTLLPY